MRRTGRTATAVSGLLLSTVMLALSACSAGDDTPSDGAAAPAPETPSAAAVDLKVADTGLGTIVVDGEGMTAYMFTKDEQGSGQSNCSGDCLTAWPPITADSEEVAADGVTGPLDTIETADGSYQITLDGWPLYTYAEDTKPGEATGQGVGGVWYVLAPDGTVIKDTGSDTGGY